MKFSEFTEYSVKITATFGSYVGDPQGPVGPFNLYSDVDGFDEPFEINIPRSDLFAGFTSHLVPKGTSVIRIKTDCWDCNSWTDAYLVGGPPATPSVTPTVSITPTISVTPTITVTKSLTPTITPSMSTSGVPPTNSVSVTPTVTPSPSTWNYSFDRAFLVVLGQTPQEVCQKTETVTVYNRSSINYLQSGTKLYYDLGTWLQPVSGYSYVREAGSNMVYYIVPDASVGGANLIGSIGGTSTSDKCPGLPQFTYYLIENCANGKRAYTQGVPAGYFGTVTAGMSGNTIFKATSDGSYWRYTGAAYYSPSNYPSINVTVHAAIGTCP